MRRIDEMNDNIENKLCNYLKENQFSMQIDESTLRHSESLLLCYVRFISNGEMKEDLLFSKLILNCKGLNVYEEIKNYFELKSISLEHWVALATDGASLMIGKYSGVVSGLKKDNLSLISIHCVVHRQHLIAKELIVKLNHSSKIIIITVNKIKRRSSSERIFSKLCDDNDETYNHLLLHTEV